MLSSGVVYALIAAPSIPLVYFLALVIKWVMNKRRISAAVDKIPGPERQFFYGNIGQIPKTGEGRLARNLENTCRFKTAYSLKIGPFISAVSLCHPSTAKKMLKTAEPKQHSDGTGYSILLDWLGKGLLINNGDGWFRNRRLLTPAFHFETLKPYAKVFNESADTFMEKVIVASNTSPDGFIEVFKPVGLCTLNVMMRCAFSHKSDIQVEGTENPYVKTVGNLSRLAMERLLNPFLSWDGYYLRTAKGKQWTEGCKYAHQVAYDLIQKRKAELANGATAETIKSKRAVDFLDILLLAKDDNGQGLTDTEIRAEVDTFLFEGHDTTASAISFCLYNIASHPEYQQKAREEVDSLLEGRDSDHIQWDDVSKLPYLTMCVKESMRHTPPVVFFGRELDNSMEIDGVNLPPGTNLFVHAYNIHHNPLVWGEDHMEYKPERFTYENMKKMDSYAFIPFSAGPRNCIGQNFAMNEIKTVLARILHRFILTVDPDRKPERIPLLVMRSENGVYVKFTPR